MSGRMDKDIDAVIRALDDVTGTLPGSMPDAETVDVTNEPVFAALTDTAPDATPPPDMFDKIEAEIDAPPLPGVETIASSSGKWLDRGNGIWCKVMASSPDCKNVYLLRCMPGSSIPEHTHSGWEYALVLEGRYQIAGRTVRAGDAQYSAANSLHPEITTDTGCLLLVVA